MGEVRHAPIDINAGFRRKTDGREAPEGKRGDIFSTFCATSIGITSTKSIRPGRELFFYKHVVPPGRIAMMPDPGS